MIKKLFLPLIIILGAIIRLIFLNLVPNAIGGDELTYILAGKSIFISGHDLTGTWNPWTVFLFQYPPGVVQAELPYFIALLSSMFPPSLFNVRIIYVLFSIATIPLLYFVAKKLTNSATTALCAAFIMSINPWEIYVGRTSYEVTPALFFFLCSLLIFLYAKGARLLFLIPFLMLAFYSYIGTKVFFLPFIAVCAWYSYSTSHYKKGKKYYVIVLLAAVFLTLFYASTLFLFKGTNRSSDIFTPFSPVLSTRVDTARKLSIANPLEKFFENKPVLYLKIEGEKIMKIFSFDYLFTAGDQFFSIATHGVFYMMDLPFLLIGLFALFSKRKKLFVFLLLLLACSIIPQLLHYASTDNFTPHIMFLFPVFFLYIAFGVTAFVSFFRKRWILVLCVIALYIFSLLNFLQIYLFQFPLQGYFDFKLRVLSSYAVRAGKKDNVMVYTSIKADTFQKYLFYANIITPQNMASINNAMKTGSYTVGNVTFLNCPTLTTTFQENTASIIDFSCPNSSSYAQLKIVQLKDNGTLYKIVNDKICNSIPLNTYIQNLKLSDFDIESLNNQDFCKSYILK